MNLKVNRINWVGNIYQKFEAVCQEVDGIVGQDAVKYLDNRVQNVGDSMKKLYSEVVHELLPFPTLSSPTKYEARSFPLKNNVGSTAGCVEDKNKDRSKNVGEEQPVNNFIDSSQDSIAMDLANDQQEYNPEKHELVNQASSTTCSDSAEVDDSFKTREILAELTIIEETALKSASELVNLISDREKEPFEFSIHNQSCSGSSDTACGGVSVRTEELCLIVEENNMNSSAEVLNFKTEKSSDAVKGDNGILAGVSSASCKRPNITETVSSYFNSSLVSDSPYSESVGSYPFEIESYKRNSGEVVLSISDSSMAHVCCEPPQIASQVKESRDVIVSSCRCQSAESNDESCSIELRLEDVQLNNDTKLEESCVFVKDSELYAVSYRIQQLRSYQKRIQDAFASKKRLAKEYEQLAIWYGDADMEPSQDVSGTRLPFSSRTYTNSKDLEVQQASETEWELL
ncbi:hypothetical protein L195_g002947 [Trifolium pratense]|uniref:Uncharacterized protein n=2 Tax=Trifolium pratense TaxID=57577 RepID=A0A2K3NTY5_TRIPR|nr:uncharacterized protein LOC123895289 [Trifolium pratense]PNY06481.1 hypothetical protein L195_g002947 [Trifolium pratense]CAJ2645437.1 unnamed protein product [Trifolium pratense]